MSGKFTRMATAVGATAAALAATAVLATPANAAGTEYYNAWSGAAANATFFSHGDIFQLADMLPDGHGVTLIADVQSGFVWTPFMVRYNGRGFGSTATYDVDIAEGRGVRFKVCLQDGVGAPVKNCSAWRYGTA